MRIGMHQPYLFPYKGYFDLIASVDKFVLYDDAKYMKGGWINRNFFPNLFTFRLKRHSDSAKINELYFFDIEQDKKEFKKKTGLLVDKYLEPLNQDLNVALNCYRTIRVICDQLKIYTPLYFASDFKHGKFVDGIVDIVKALGGDTYVNAPGGRDLYTQDMFNNIKLEFIETTPSQSILCSL